MAKVAVVGAGISGLAAAHALTAAGHTVAVHESSGRVGGALRTTPLAGLDVEEGADAFLVRVPQAVALARAVGLDVVHPATSSAAVYAGGRLRPLPAGTILGVPGSLRGLRAVLTPIGVARAAADLVLPAAHRDGDRAIGEVVRTRLGRQVLDRLVDPLLGGVYAGSAAGLSVRATAPALADPGRSLLRTVAARRPVPSNAPVFGSVPGGTGAFVEAVANAIRAAGGTIQTGCGVTGLARRGAGWRLAFGPAGRQHYEDVEAVVLAVPAPRAARLLAGHVLDALLPATAYASVGIVTLVYPAGTALPAGSGFLVAPSERRTVKAVTFVGPKWGHPPGAPVIVRASVGRFGAGADLQRPDSELAGLAAADVAAMTGVRGRPRAWRVTRWGGALPQYAPGHLERVGALRRGLPPGLALCGAAYDGVGIPACAGSGQQAARDVSSQLGG